jgi:hypothetical protein
MEGADFQIGGSILLDKCVGDLVETDIKDEIQFNCGFPITQSQSPPAISDRPLGRCFDGCDLGSGLSKLKSQDPYAGDGLIINLRRLEPPVPRCL